MDQESTPFEQFFAERIKEKGVSLKKLSDATGIAPVHIENLLRGDFGVMPSAPYFRGYLIRLGKALDFDGEGWWGKFKKEGVVKNSGELDTMPRNRFIKKAPPKFLWAIGAGVVILIYLIFQATRIFGKPSLTVTFPDHNPYVTSSSTLTLTGTVGNADSLYLSNGNASSGEEVAIAPDGTWQKTVLLSNGLNPFEISAKKFLGRGTDITEEIIYQSGPTQTPTSSNNPAGHPSTTSPATGTSPHL